MLKGSVEVDEIYLGGRRFGRGHHGKLDNKSCVVSLVERGGKARSMVLDRVTGQNLKNAIMQHVQDGSVVVTDDYFGYRNLPKIFKHKSVKHSAEEVLHLAKEAFVRSLGIGCGRQNYDCGQGIGRFSS